MNNKEAEKRFIYNSMFGGKVENSLIGECKKAVMIIMGNHDRNTIEILDIDGLTDSEVVSLVNITSKQITEGCNYTYDIVGRIDNTFFLR